MTETEKLFETALFAKYRYQTAIGTLSTEDLCELKLDELDKIAKDLNKQVKDSGEESFIKVKTNANKTIEAKFEIVKLIIERKLEENDKKAKAKENAIKRAYLKELIGKKENNEMESKTIEELRKEFDDLDN